MSDTNNGVESSTEFTVDMICEAIRDAADDAIASEDYISYATVLDVNLSNPSRFEDRERVQLLQELHAVLIEHDVLVKEIGWDLPALLLEFLSCDYNNSSIREVPGVKQVMDIFALISTKGNPKEVFLKSIESLTGLRLDDEVAESDQVNGERNFDVKFYAVYQLMQYSMQRIETQYPSRFLATSTSALLSCLAVNMEDMSPMSLSVVLRRLFLFARDYEMPAPKEGISDKECKMQRDFLQSYISWCAELTFQRFSVRWANRLYIEIKAKCEKQSQAVRKQKYHERQEVVNITECIERLAQLLISFDVDVDEEMTKLVEADKKEVEDDNDNEELFKGISDDGLLLLATQLKFDDRESSFELDFSQLVKIGTKFLSRDDGLAPYGVIDAVIFWSLWTCREVTKEQVQQVDKTQVFQYLQQMCAITAMSTEREVISIVNTLVAKVLSLCEESVALEWILDTFEHCPYERVRESVIHMLKSLIIYKRPTDLADQLANVKLGEEQKKPCPFLHVGGERLKSVKDMAKLDIDQAAKEGLYGSKFGTLLSWLNFFTVIESDDKFVKDIKQACQGLVDEKPGEEKEEDGLRRQEILSLAITRLETKWA